jgi:predicted P-loop ATPase
MEYAIPIVTNRENSSQTPPVSEPKKQALPAVTESGKRSKRQRIESYLDKRFRFRLNVLTNNIEFSYAAKNQFEVLTDYLLNSICRDIDREAGYDLSPATLNNYLKSDFVKTYHPLQAYFDGLPKRSGQVAIDKLAATVTVDNPDVFALALTRWLVATVANAIAGEGCQNQTCLVLVGDQGAFKTTWLNNLCPPSLKKYLFTGRADLNNKDSLMLLATKFIINFDDQLRAMNKRDAETLKTYITQGDTDIRLPYGVLASRFQRVASICGSINGSDFLTDPTGSRRFLPFEVNAININDAQALNMDDVWAEALTLYRRNYQYWFTSEETTTYFGNNEQFQVSNLELDLLQHHYEPVEVNHPNAQCFKSGILRTDLEKRTGQRLRTREFGAALKKLGFILTTKRQDNVPTKMYVVRERSAMELDSLKRPHESIF